MTLDVACPKCRERAQLELSLGQAEAACPACRANLLCYATDDFLQGESLGQCPVCGCAHLYRQKDFNRALGIGILVAGIGLAYFTYGLSLLGVTAIDWLLYRRVGEVACCYLCGALLRNAAGLGDLPPFNLVLHDHYRALRESKLEAPPPAG